jgi:hypothetical protein
MTRKYIPLLAVGALLTAGCNNSDDAESIYLDNDLAVHFTAGVEGLTTRATVSTPLTKGTTVKISRDGSTYYDYESTDAAGTLVPTTSQFVTWAASKEDGILIYACTPVPEANSSGAATAHAFTLPTNQTSGTTYADYATFVGTVNRLGTSLGAANYNDVQFNMQRRLSQVKFSITECDPAFANYQFVLTVHSAASGVEVAYNAGDIVAGIYETVTVELTGESCAVKPYNRTLMLDADGAADKAVAIITPCSADALAKFVTVEMIDPANPNAIVSTMDVVGRPALQPGVSYTFELDIEDDRVKVGDVQVTNWTTERIVGSTDATLEISNPYKLDLDNHEGESDSELHDLLYEVFTEYSDKVSTLTITGALGSRDLYSILSGISMKEIDMTGLTGLTYLSELFYGNTTLQKVSLSEEVTEIGGFTFYNCSNLVSISAPGATYVGYRAFDISSEDGTSSSGSATLTTLDLPKAKYFESAPFGWEEVTNFTNCDLTLNAAASSYVSGNVFTYDTSITFKSITLVDDNGKIVDEISDAIN